MSKLKWLLMLMLSLMLGCRGSIVTVDSSCAWVKPIYTSEADRKQIPREVKEQMAVHNDLYASHCLTK